MRCAFLRPKSLVYRSGGEKEPHTVGVDRVQGMNQALGEANTFLTGHGRHKTSQGRWASRS
ncbi:hypothetical protein DUNSADRAFT_6992 [Dunaliella salina]|uniref:Encoded protein n=1 Tax=Dunaliella salina TaxID=3046 RepID=A0ABQ7GM77_DUNSA|nr:hypothetical protein DUNSADRAFT_6992 [Dunaliella salina]|eukprot:KAF5835713.1 hypothetical protein DUNSADRAFT_6992 [Dunaliella salina]